MGIILYLADRLARHQRRLPGITLTDAILIGLSQALAIMPGVSRSGSTMTMGLILGFHPGNRGPIFFSHVHPDYFRGWTLSWPEAFEKRGNNYVFYFTPRPRIFRRRDFQLSHH